MQKKIINKFESFEELPDIENGYLIFGEDGKNKWQTNIKSALISSNSSKKDIYYLSKECRAESLNNKNIFTIGEYEFSPIASDKGYNFVIRTYPLIPKIISATSFGMLSNYSIPANIFVKTNKIEKLSFKEVLNLLDRNLSINGLYIKLSYPYKEELLTILCPANYINYQKTKDDCYLQVIQGDIIIKDKNKLNHAYIAAKIRENGIHAELIIKGVAKKLRRSNLYKLNSKSSIFKKLYWLIFDLLYRLIPFYEVNYNKRKIIGDIPFEFFRYSKVNKI